MKTQVLSSLAAAAAFTLAGMLPLAAQAQATQLKPAAERISDAAIAADQQAYETLQGRIKGLNDKGRLVRDYHLSKAQCWLDVSFHEYTRNDRSAFPQEAMTESEKLIVGMEKGAKLGTETPLVNGAARLRPDLWERATKIHGTRGFICAQHKLACSEVELVHAGNEFNQQQWRHAKPYVQIAEDLMVEAEALAKSCPELAPAEVVAPPVVPPVVLPPVREVELGAHVVFNFDKFTEGDIRSYSLAQLESLVARIKRDKLEVVSIGLSGHADRLNGTGQSDYNQRLSEKRVATVRDILVRLGIDAKRISTVARGDQQQVEACRSGYRSQAELQECLLPNRRVEVTIVTRGAK